MSNRLIVKKSIMLNINEVFSYDKLTKIIMAPKYFSNLKYDGEKITLVCCISEMISACLISY
jgi:hypothetical protein